MTADLDILDKRAVKRQQQEQDDRLLRFNLAATHQNHENKIANVAAAEREFSAALARLDWQLTPPSADELVASIKTGELSDSFISRCAVSALFQSQKAGLVQKLRDEIVTPAESELIRFRTENAKLLGKIKTLKKRGQWPLRPVQLMEGHFASPEMTGVSGAGTFAKWASDPGKAQAAKEALIPAHMRTQPPAHSVEHREPDDVVRAAGPS